MSAVTKVASGATGFIVRNFGVAPWVAILAKYGLIALISGGLIWGFADHYYDKGVADCEADQATANALIPPIADDLNKKTEEANDAYSKTTKQNDSDLAKGLTQLDVSQAQNRGYRAGAEEGRRSAIADARANGNSCFNDPAALTDGVRRSVQSLQQDIFGDDSQVESGDSGADDKVQPSSSRKEIP